MSRSDMFCCPVCLLSGVPACARVVVGPCEHWLCARCIIQIRCSCCPLCRGAVKRPVKRAIGVRVSVSPTVHEPPTRTVVIHTVNRHVSIDVHDEV